MNVQSQPANDDEWDELGTAPCKSLISDLPTEWYAWPVSISVGFVTTPTTCVYRKLFEEYRADSLKRAMDMVFAPGSSDLFIGYRFHAVGFVPAYEYFAAWPLVRRGKDEPTDTMIGSFMTAQHLERGIRKREPMGGAAPWDVQSDDTVFEIWHEPVNVCGSRTVLMLRVGGRNQDQAKENWGRCARALRNYSRTVTKMPAM